MRKLDGDIISEALEALGATLSFRGIQANLVIIGGGNLIYAGLISRTVTRDLDELAFGRDWMTNWADGDLLAAADDVIAGLS